MSRYIDADKLDKKIDEILNDPEEYDKPIHDMLREFYFAPTEDVEPKRPKGEWIINPRIDAGRFEIKCSECGDIFIRSVGHIPNFCEYCGADMRGDKE